MSQESEPEPQEGEADDEEFDAVVFACIRCGFESLGEKFRSFTGYCDPCLDDVVAPIEKAGFPHHILRCSHGNSVGEECADCQPEELIL